MALQNPISEETASISTLHGFNPTTFSAVIRWYSIADEVEKQHHKSNRHGGKKMWFMIFEQNNKRIEKM